MIVYWLGNSILRILYHKNVQDLTVSELNSDGAIIAHYHEVCPTCNLQANYSCMCSSYWVAMNSFTFLGRLERYL